MSLYLKYEPKNLDEILANEDNKTILKGFLKQKEIPQVYLFYGSYGCGKSLISNLLAKELNCGNNIYELNASNDRGIDAIRQVIESCKYRTLDGKNKSYIIEECHQLPTLSQEAFLTTFQNPPKNVYFFLCTTEKSKMLPTIISRCKCIEVNPLSVIELYPYLIEISKKENNEISRIVARKIAETSEGHVRDALQILEKVLQFENEEKQLEIAKIQIEENAEVIELCRKLLNGNWKECQIILKNLKEQPENIRRVILGYMEKVLLNSDNSNNWNKAVLIIEGLKDNLFNSGRAGLISAIYQIFL